MAIKHPTVKAPGNTLAAVADWNSNHTIDPLTIGTAELANLAVTEGKIANLAVAEGKIANLAVAEGKLANSAVTPAKMSTAAKTHSIIYVIDGGGAEIAPGSYGDPRIPFNCTITKVTLLADQVGSIQVDIYKDTYANYPPTVADSITAAAVPAIAAGVKYEDATLTGWTTGITAGDTLRYNVDSVATIQRVTVILDVVKT